MLTNSFIFISCLTKFSIRLILLQSVLINKTNKMKKIYLLLVALVASAAVSAQCTTDLFFSEYIEGLGNNKAVEIYNPTGAAINLNGYVLYRYNNGSSTASDSLFPQGIIASNDVFVIGNASAAEAKIIAETDTNHTYTFYNGDDALMIMKISTRDTLDVFGVIGIDPGAGWDIKGATTANSTLVRNYSVQQGVATWDTAQWAVFATDYADNLGTHSSSCYPAPPTEPSSAASNPTKDAKDVISIYSESYTDPATINYFPGWGQSTQYSVFEIGTDSMIKYSALNYQGIDFDASEIDASSMEMLHIDIWTANVDDIDIFPISRTTGEKPVKKTLTAGQWNSIDIPLSDYTSQSLSMSDIFQFKFDNLGASRGTGTIFIDNMYFWKSPSYTVAKIRDLIQLDADLAATNEDDLFEVTGVVYGGDLDGNAGLSFTIIDSTAGINIFNFNDINDYVVTEGDEITVRGKIDFYRGLLELVADSIRVNSSKTLKDPRKVAAPSEDTESDFIQLIKVWITNDTTTLWPDNGNVQLTNSSKDTFEIRIDRDFPGMVGMPVEFDTMTIIGIGGQFDATAPYNSGYQIFPRKLADIMEWKAPSSISELYVKTNVYPNPTSNNLTVVGAEKWNTFEVYSVMGVKVSEGSLMNNNLGVANLSTGTYILRLHNADKDGVARFVINK
jgi:hypothetical protein